MVPDPNLAAALGTVRIVGTGLLGTSIALGLRALNVHVVLADPSPTALALAAEMGAGQADDGTAAISLVVVAAPPDVTAGVVARELREHPGAVVTDVASVKGAIAANLAAAGADLTRYVGGHPMAGRERSGAIAARADLFFGRPWVICPPEAPQGSGESSGEAAHRVASLVRALGAVVVTMSAAEHDQAVAVVSHLPQVAASLVASALRGASDEALTLAGQGLRDLTRIADSDPMLWSQILLGNAASVRPALQSLRDEVDQLIAALEPGVAGTSAVASLISAGNQGRQRIPGKHGQPPQRYAVVTVLVPDAAGELARLFADIGRAGVNVEEFALEHAPGAAVGLAGVSVLPTARGDLEKALAQTGWQVVA